MKKGEEVKKKWKSGSVEEDYEIERKRKRRRYRRLRRKKIRRVRRKIT